MRLPPLNALRAFEAAARHASFARAAEELHVSQGAISRHVKLLEAYFGVQLFRRLARGVAPTDAAVTLLPKISASFELIEKAALEIADVSSEIKVICSPTFAYRWLIPRLPDFQAVAPSKTVSVGILRSSYEEFYKGAYDIGIACFESAVEWPDDLHAEWAVPEEMTALCAPALMRGANAPKTPADLRHHLLLHAVLGRHDWRRWLEAVGAADVVDYRRGQSYETGEMAIRAAAEGLGVAMMDRRLVKEELASGALVTPFDHIMTEDTGYYLFFERKRSDDPAIVAFRDWFLREAGAE
jgi:LysR family glycine cleavage system transcriptional activator